MKNYKELVIGNLREGNMKEIWNSEKRILLKEKMANFSGNSPECGSCTAVVYSKACKENF